MAVELKVSPLQFVFCMRGVSFWAKKEYARALEDLNRAVDIDPKMDAAIAFRAAVFSDGLGRHDEAISELSKVIQRNPAYSLPYVLRGAAYGVAKRIDEAFADFRKAEELSPNWDFLYLNRAHLYEIRKELQPAIDDYTKAAEVSPGTYIAFYRRGVLHRKRKEYSLAISDHSKAIDIRDDFAPAYNARGFAYENLDQTAEAEKDYDRAIQLAPMFYRAYLNRGGLSQRKGNFDLAVADYSKAIEINPKNAEGFLRRGNTNIVRGLLKEAAEDYQRAIELKPEKASAYRDRAILNLWKGNCQEAVHDLLKARKFSPEDEYTCLQLLCTLWLIKEDASKTLAQLRETVLKTDSREWVRSISKYLVDRQDSDDSAVLAEAVKGESERRSRERLCEAFFYLGMKKLSQGNKTAAVEYLTKSANMKIYTFYEYRMSKAVLKLLQEGALTHQDENRLTPLKS